LYFGVAWLASDLRERNKPSAQGFGPHHFDERHYTIDNGVANMLSHFLRTSALAAFCFAPAIATAQQPVVNRVESRVESNQFRAKQVLGTKIMIQGNTAVGTVDDLVFDEAGNLDFLIVDNGGKLVTVPWDAAKFDVEKRTAVLSITPDQYRTIPTYTTTTYPNFYTPTYRTEIYRLYNLTPRDLRRIERRR
jgi:hypothetical protein